MSSQILYPSEVYAYRVGNDPKVTIIAKGHEDGYCKIRIEQSAAQIYPPIFMVVGDPCEVIGYFPYTVSKSIPYATDLDFVFFQTGSGTEKIPVRNLLDEKGAVPEALTQTNSKQVVGYAYNSSDINIAIADAVSKLQKLFPGNTNAVLVKSGFVGVGMPIGIAYYYVIMEQQ